MENQKNKRGGVRPGAGRPSLTDKKIPLRVYIRASDLAVLKEKFGTANLQQFLERVALGLLEE